MNKFERFTPVLLVAGVGFFVLSLGAMGFLPWITMRGLKPPETLPAYTSEELRGRQVYIAEACWHCHTLFVRPVAREPERYGPPSRPEESLYDIPQLYGTRRVGPDLAREAGRRSDDWQLAHLANPRNTTPWSVMPPFPWLFKKEGNKIVPTEDGKALVAFLQSQGRAVKEEMAKADASWAASFRGGPPPLETEALKGRGAALFRRECAGCHGPNGDGNGSARPFLGPPPERLSRVKMTAAEAFRNISLGAPGSSMPHWREYGDEDRWALAFHVVRLHREEPLPAGAPQRSEALLARGRTLFQIQCAACHGNEGRGDGPAAAALKPSVPDFTVYSPNTAYAYEVMVEGIPGSAMVAFAGVSEQDRWALAHYVSSLYTGR
ncbi:MAG: cbb3-type cytochrome c oxidase subunit II [Candidatus Tectomicrobia bacterium]|uniref:Cbb3-type cytochrome c oxidase subunit II n=1 Tax=Tectimicrobiota bacterium TaxID=2528274 RepID=A0A932GRF4_UNCTE|nr:cbb3-type cytochrome c oxidase subunit II [Candidatus Tectomicrobia bacterium]